MYIKRYGSGPEAYLGLHGWGGSHQTFAPLASRLPERVSLYAADLPGFGRSPAPGEWTLSAIVDQIAEGVNSLGVERVTVIGNCSGAIFGLLAAGRLGERITRFALIDPFAYVPWYFRVFVERSWGRYAYYSTFANPVGRWITNLSLKGRRASDTDMTGSFKAVNHEVSYRYLALLAEIDGIGGFKDIRLPIDIIYGERTFGAVRQSIGMWRAAWPQARCYELAGAGHLPIEEAADRLGQIIFTREESATRIAGVSLSRR